MVHIIKRRGQKQEFDERKVYASVYAACLASHTSHEEAEATANLVSREVKRWLDKRQDITSNQIFNKAWEELKHLNKDAAFMYKTHRDVS